jgi:hypothetical protein
MKPFIFLITILALVVAVTPTLAAPSTPLSYTVVINPPDNNRNLLFKGKVNSAEIKGWWLDVTVDGQPLETFLKTHPKFKFVLTTSTGTKTEITATDYLKGGLRFPFGNLTLTLLDDNGAPVFSNLKIQPGGGDSRSGGNGSGSGNGSSGGGDGSKPPGDHQD